MSIHHFSAVSLSARDLFVTDKYLQLMQFSVVLSVRLLTAPCIVNSSELDLCF
jgi:hypothetical protein